MDDSVVFNTPWDQKLTALTILISAILLGATIVISWLALTREASASFRLFLTLNAIILLGVFVAGALLAPRGFALGGGSLRIKRSILPIEIPLASIRSVERLAPEGLAGSTRTLGSGGFFGYYGRFRNRTLGDYRMYATRGEGYVLVRADCPYVLTPASPDRFIEALNRARGATSQGAAGRGGDPAGGAR